MCNFVPNECFAVASKASLDLELSKWDIPGRILIMPLIQEGDGTTDPRFDDFGVAHVVDIPDGLEVLVASKLSAALSHEISNHRAVVELNYLLPLVSPISHEHELEERFRGAAKLSEFAAFQAEQIRGAFSYNPLAGAAGPKVGLLDSGLNSEMCRRRNVMAYDYTRESVVTLPVSDHDMLGHGTRVATVLDAALPWNVPFVSGKIAQHRSHVTVLSLIRAFAHLVARERPSVVNISAAPRDDEIACREGRPAKIPGSHTNSLPFVINMALPETTTVMAAGNAGQPCNARFVLAGTTPPIFAVAVDSAGRTGALF